MRLLYFVRRKLCPPSVLIEAAFRRGLSHLPCVDFLMILLHSFDLPVTFSIAVLCALKPFLCVAKSLSTLPCSLWFLNSLYPSIAVLQPCELSHYTSMIAVRSVVCDRNSVTVYGLLIPSFISNSGKLRSFSFHWICSCAFSAEE